MRHLCILIVASSLCVTGKAFSDSASDALFDAVAPKAGLTATQENNTAGEGAAAATNINMNDPVIRQFFAEVESSQLSYDVKQWAYKILKGQWSDAAHSWSSMAPQLPVAFRGPAEVAYTYTLWQLELPETFISQWIPILTKPNLAQSRMELALEQSVTPRLDQWLLDKAIVLSPGQLSAVEKLTDTKSLAVLDLKAYGLLRTGEKAEPILSLLPADNKFKPLLANTVILAAAKRKDLVGAAKIMRNDLEPALEAQGTPEQLAQHYLNVARLLSTAGQFDAAENFYLKIPNGVPEYYWAHEELTWIWLRKGNTSRLRGELATLSSPVFNSRFTPELYVVEAISSLKLCFFENVQKDLDKFNSTNSIWAKKIDQALASSSTPTYEKPDFFTQLAQRGIIQITTEQKRIQDLNLESPAIAESDKNNPSNPKLAVNQLAGTLELAKKRLATEFRRQWKNDQSALTEAIKKMRFVKVEYLNQVHQLAQSAEVKANLTASSEATPARTLVGQTSDQLSFPADGTVWPDELFKLRSAAQSRCQQLGAKR